MVTSLTVSTPGRVQVWERVHVVAAGVVVVFGVVHSRKVWVALAPGIVLYGIDVAHRCMQASRTATASICVSGDLISAVIPLEVRPLPAPLAVQQCGVFRQRWECGRRIAALLERHAQCIMCLEYVCRALKGPHGHATAS
jgi:hypothetical protein